MNMTKMKLATCLASSVFLAACGGGSGDSTTGPQEGPKLLAAGSACTTTNWVSGQNYVTGSIVLFNGVYYKASHDNPGYDPTISTYYWDRFATVWTAGTNYAVGTAVKYNPNGTFYREVAAGTNGSDGTDPSISSYYWQPAACNVSSTTTTTKAATTTTKAATTTTTKATTTTTAAGCTFSNWTTGVNYSVGTVVKYPANGNYYKEVAAGTNGSDGTDPTISTYYWQPTTCGGQAASSRIVGGYWPNWLPSAIRVRDVNPNYNLIYLFSAQPVGGSPGTTGAVYFTPPGDGRGAATNFNADVQYARTVQGRKVILSIGGAGNGMSFPDRTHSQNFVNSIVALYNQFGGFDGIDWDNFEADQVPDTSEMIWISLELKRRYPGFMITSPPAPWQSRDLTFCQAMVQAGAMDYAGPQYYDGPGLADPAYVVSNIDQWVSALGASHVVIGFGVDTAANYMTSAQAVTTWNQVKAKYPAIHGGFDWAISTDENQGWPFANNVGSLIKQ